MDIIQNSIRANARHVSVSIDIDETLDLLKIDIGDDGDGMDAKSRGSVTDPFYTTRATRKVGLGLPYYEMAAKICGGNFEIQSRQGIGTLVSAGFGLSHIDRAPLGDIGQTFSLLAGANPCVDFALTLTRKDGSFRFDTREIKDLLGGVRIDTPEIIVYMDEYINENIQYITRGIEL